MTSIIYVGMDVHTTNYTLCCICIVLALFRCRLVFCTI